MLQKPLLRGEVEGVHFLVDELGVDARARVAAVRRRRTAGRAGVRRGEGEKKLSVL